MSIKKISSAYASKREREGERGHLFMFCFDSYLQFREKKERERERVHGSA